MVSAGSAHSVCLLARRAISLKVCFSLAVECSHSADPNPEGPQPERPLRGQPIRPSNSLISTAVQPASPHAHQQPPSPKFNRANSVVSHTAQADGQRGGHGRAGTPASGYGQGQSMLGHPKARQPSPHGSHAGEQVRACSAAVLACLLGCSQGYSHICALLETLGNCCGCCTKGWAVNKKTGRIWDDRVLSERRCSSSSHVLSQKLQASRVSMNSLLLTACRLWLLGLSLSGYCNGPSLAAAAAADLGWQSSRDAASAVPTAAADAVQAPSTWPKSAAITAAAAAASWPSAQQPCGTTPIARAAAAAATARGSAELFVFGSLTRLASAAAHHCGWV